MEEQDPQQPPQEPEIRPDEPVTVEELIPESESAPAPPLEDTALRAVVEAMVYVAEEPLTPAQLSNVLGQPVERVRDVIAQIVAEFERPEHGVTVREVAGGYKMATKPEHHDAVRAFARSLKPPLKLSLAALETLAVIAYKQPVTVPEIQEVRGVQGAGVVKTLLDRKLVVPAGRKNVVGKPILYKTTKEFLIQFGLKDLSELPSLKEFEEIRRMAFGGEELSAPSDEAPQGGEVIEISRKAGEEAPAAPAEDVPPEIDSQVSERRSDTGEVIEIGSPAQAEREEADAPSPAEPVPDQEE